VSRLTNEHIKRLILDNLDKLDYLTRLELIELAQSMGIDLSGE